MREGFTFDGVGEHGAENCFYLRGGSDRRMDKIS
jgi:hypothetical protein